MTLAMMEAAAIDRLVPSPPTTHCVAQPKGGAILPSTSAQSGVLGRRRTARCMARWLARRILIVSISATEAAPTPISTPDAARSA
jgi:hypothetical protein